MEMLKNAFYVIVLCIGFAACATSGVVVCATEEDCVPNEATCVENICQCPKDQTLSYDGTKCLKYAVTYNAQCIEDVQCALLLGKHACVDLRCRCQSGWKYYWGRCVKRAEIGIEMECKGNEDCFNGIDYFASSCKTNGTCICNTGYYARGKFDCRPISKEDGEICAIDLDCQYENAYCQYGLCATKTAKNDAKFVRAFLAERTQKTNNNRDLNISCKDNDDCATSNSHCHLLFKVCVCDRGHYEFEGSCIAELGIPSNCRSNTECKIENSKCTEGVCTCKQTHVYGDGNQFCRKSTTSPDYSCASNESCALFGENYYCDFDQIAFRKKCVCTMGSKFDPETALCVGNALECSSDYICKLTEPNSICDNFKCICTENFVEDEGSCMPLIDGACEFSEDCRFVENTECDAESKTCKCAEDTVNYNNNECIPIAEGLNSDCLVNEQCSRSISHSLCVDNMCACTAEYIANNDVCIKDKLYESYCESNEICLNAITTDFTCKNSKCVCPDSMSVRPDKRGCSEQRGSSTSVRTDPIAVVCILLVALYKFI